MDSRPKARVGKLPARGNAVVRELPGPAGGIRIIKPPKGTGVRVLLSVNVVYDFRHQTTHRLKDAAVLSFDAAIDLSEAERDRIIAQVKRKVNGAIREA